MQSEVEHPGIRGFCEVLHVPNEVTAIGNGGGVHEVPQTMAVSGQTALERDPASIRTVGFDQIYVHPIERKYRIQANGDPLEDRLQIEIGVHCKTDVSD